MFDSKHFNITMVKQSMEAFNIKIQYQNQGVTITILLTDEGYYKVIYFGGILGAVKKREDNEKWEKVPDEDIIAGELPLYRHDHADRLDVILDDSTAMAIGKEIEKEIDTTEA